jgi:CubicO group peptidase (beta-lactamase class C family)
MALDEASLPFNADRLRRGLDAVVAEATESGRIVGSVVLASLGGGRGYERAAGYADREAKIAATPATLFRWASLTKPVVSATTLALVERGVVALDDPVTKFIPDFRPRLASGETPVILLRHLLTHTSGLTYRLLQPEGGPYHRADVSDGMDQPGLSIDENLRRIASAPLAFAPGAAWLYSVAIDVLGAVIARAAGESLPALVERLVARPLGMAEAGFVVPDRSRLATPYGDGSPAPVRMGETHRTLFADGAISFAPDRMFDPKSYPSGGGGMSGSAEDFLVFLEAMRQGGAPVLSRQSVDRLARVATGDLATFVPGWGFSLGWSILRDPSLTGTPQSPGTWRWGGVYGNSWFVDPACQLSVVVLTNTAIGGMVGPYPDALRDAIYAARE